MSETDETPDATEVGTYAALEGDDNAIDVSNPGYIGVDPEYRNSASDLDRPVVLTGDDADPIADRAIASAEELTNLNVNRAGFEPGEQRAGLGIKVDSDAKGPSVAEQAAQAPGVMRDPEATPAEEPAADDSTGTEDGSTTADPNASNQSGGTWGSGPTS